MSGIALNNEQIGYLTKIEEILENKFNHKSYEFCKNNCKMMKQQLCSLIFKIQINIKELLNSPRNIWDTFYEFFKDTLDDIFESGNDITKDCFRKAFIYLIVKYPDGATQSDCLDLASNGIKRTAVNTTRNNGLIINN